jgi:hypothetical protein
MTSHSNEIHSGFESFKPVSRPNHSAKVGETINVSHAERLADILFEQLEYLLRHCDEERERLSRVTTILLEAFQ